jgi:hypothetical protein
MCREFNESRISIPGPAGNLAGMLTWPAGKEPDLGVLICSPSPLLGGDMENNVTEALARTAAMKGYAALRFDYRNAGRSEDSTEGRPRFEWWHAREETRDCEPVLDDAGAALRAARRFFLPVATFGYSFGAWVGWQTAVREELPVHVAICPPLSRLDFAGMGTRGPEVLLVAAGGDELDPPPPQETLKVRFPDACVLRLCDADHFLLGEEHRAAVPALAFLAAVPAPEQAR